MLEEKDTPAPQPRDDRYVDKVTEQRIHEHLADPNSKITEEDIARVNTDIFRRPLTDEEKEADEEQVKKDIPPTTGSTWDMLD